jgi:galactose mutarotase-like enzyme
LDLDSIHKHEGKNKQFIQPLINQSSKNSISIRGVRYMESKNHIHSSLSRKRNNLVAKENKQKTIKLVFT